MFTVREYLTDDSFPSTTHHNSVNEALGYASYMVTNRQCQRAEITCKGKYEATLTYTGYGPLTMTVTGMEHIANILSQ